MYEYLPWKISVSRKFRSHEMSAASNAGLFEAILARSLTAPLTGRVCLVLAEGG